MDFNTLLLNRVIIGWNRISKGSYLRNIAALSGVDRVSFSHAITFFVGENGSGKSTLLEAITVAYGINRRAAQGIITFPHMIPIRNSVMQSGFPEVFYLA